MKISTQIALRAFNLFLALAATLLPLKTTNVFATEDTTDATSPPTCKDGYEYVESVGKCYKKCADGWERNSETNRCRKIRVEEVAEEETAASPGTTSSKTDSAESSAKTDVATKAETSAGSKTESKAEASSSSTKVSADDSTKVETETIPTCKDGYEYVEAAGKCYKACTEDQERNPETLRCRKKTSDSAASSSTSASSSTDSSSVEYANESTPTCKAGYEYVESADKCYKACTSEQERNPETNRCRKKTSTSGSTSSSSSASSSDDSETTCKDGYEYVESAGKCYKACTEDQERNPETNRCRKKQDNDGADYDVEVPETGGSSAFVATGAIVALVLAGIGFVAFQYRAELKKFFEKRSKKS